MNNSRPNPVPYNNLNAVIHTGLDFLRKLTTSENYELRVDMEDFLNNRVHAKYRYFEGEDKRVVRMFQKST